MWGRQSWRQAGLPTGLGDFFRQLTENPLSGWKAGSPRIDVRRLAAHMTLKLRHSPDCGGYRFPLG